ncbi:MAG: PAS domain-containing protein [Betaproteobacteria bacterium]|nr:PAS domain-containing protein [Betaproteobacteria bacterium]
MSEENDPHFVALLEFLQVERGFDFSGYKRPSLMRRVRKRMQLVGMEQFDRYIEYLEVHPEEFVQLFNTILINVTSFFRDEAPWDFLAKEVLPQILGAKGAHEQVRIWSAGCASGQEAYSLAIAFTEALGPDAFRERVKIYGTDADEEALNVARLASYGAKDVETMPPELLKRYFEAQGNRFVFRPDLRRSIIFGRHDIVQDAPISRLDLLVCRNTLMYFNAETQQKILQRFHFALNGGGKGYLFLGRAEMLLGHSALFTPVNLKCRIFAKVAQPGAPRVRPPLADNGNGTDLMRNDRLRELAHEESPVARIIVDGNGTLVMANQRARVTFSINPKDVGRPLQDLEISYRPAELRSPIEQAYAERRSITLTSVERRFQDGERQYFDIIVAPLFDESQAPIGVGITFLDVSPYSRLSEELQRSREEIQTANEELQSSNEELETTNEELQSSNEELETTNEELQSTNEELETMNEELQSTNEELQTVNEELRQRTEEMNHLNAFLESVLTGMRAAAVVVNQNLNVLVWNRRAEDLWGLRVDEVQGRSLLNLDIGLPVGQLRDILRPSISGEKDHQEVVVDAVNRRGKSIKCRITCTPLVSASKHRDGAILLMEEVAS